jgi:hypothetical protein
LTKVFDTVALDSTASICATAIGGEGGTYVSLLPVECPRSDVKSIFFLGYSMSGESYILEGDEYSAQPEDYEFGKTWVDAAEKLWSAGKLKTHPEVMHKGGLLGALRGMQAMRDGKGPSGGKWVYRVDDTEWP